MLAKEIVKSLNELAPPYLAEKWDNSGLQLGSLEKEVKNVLIALDISPDMLSEEILNNTDMIITHHPLIFSGIKNICRDNKRGEMIYNLIRKDIVVFAVHTNLDICENGVNKVLGDLIGINNMDILKETYSEKLYKLVVFVPNTHSDEVRSTIIKAGAGHIGEYSHCTYNVEGKGIFKPLEGTNPFIGEVGKIEEVDEVRIETIVPKNRLKKVLSSMKKVHPYEEVAFDVYLLENDYIKYGLGKIGELDKIVDIASFAEELKEKIECNNLRIYKNLDKMISRVAICGGSGSEFIKDAYRKGADLYITGDIKYHDVQLASELGINLIDAGHYDTEKHIIDFIKKYLNDVFENDLSIDIHKKNNFSSLDL